MKKIKLLMLLAFISLISPGVQAQVTTEIPGFIISEWRGGWTHNQLYTEMANVGKDTLDLSKFAIEWVNGSGSQFTYENGLWGYSPATGQRRLRLSGVLPPGKTFLAVQASNSITADGDTVPTSPRMDLLNKADLAVIGTTTIFFNFGSHGSVIWYYPQEGDSILIDCVKLNLTANLQTTSDALVNDVAGVPDATRTYTLVRKANVKTGNMDWKKSKGVTAEDSEWIPLFMQPNESNISFTTPGVHGVFDIVMKSSELEIDMNNATIKVPWGLFRGDSIISKVAWGDGMAWRYWDSPNVSDSAHLRVMNGDTIDVFAVGNELKQKRFAIKVAEPTADQVEIIPLSYKNVNGAWVQPYNLLRGEILVDTLTNESYLAMDSIIGVPYATRIDTLYKYMEKVPNATWEIVWVDGIKRADLKLGDILKVTGRDGVTTKEYFIRVNAYNASNNVQLSSIIWPDKAEYMEGWAGDTIPGFSSTKTAYQITLPYGTTEIPVLYARPVNINSSIQVNPAQTVNGGLERRTTTFTVTSESNTLSQVYKVLFTVEKDPSKIQDWAGDPFISEFVTTQFSWANYLEIVNPGTVPLDLSNYLFVRGLNVIPGVDMVSLVPALPTAADFQNRYRSYVPGYKFYDDTTNWLLAPGKLLLDAAINPIVQPGDVFVMASTSVNRYAQIVNLASTKEIDKLWQNQDGVSNTLDDKGVNVTNVPAVAKRGGETICVYKILNDSVLEGTKPIGDPYDYKLVDIVGDPMQDGVWTIAGITINANARVWCIRKPNIYKGDESTKDSYDGFGTSADTSNWIVRLFGTGNNDILSQNIGFHIMNPVTVYLSTITSPIFRVSDGYSKNETLQGDMTGMTVSTFFDNVTKADKGQVLTVLSGVSGIAKTENQEVAENDILVVVSADGKSTTKYRLINAPLDGDATLVAAKAISNLKFYEITDTTGLITGVEYGIYLKDFITEVKTSSVKAMMSIVDGKGNPIPYNTVNSNGEKVAALVGDDVYIAVAAQDGIHKITYKLDPSSLTSDAYVISSVYMVDQDRSEIAGMVTGTSVKTLLANVEAVRGASVKILSKLGNERTNGVVSYDDVLVVESENKSNTKTYFLTFVNETVKDGPLFANVKFVINDLANKKFDGFKLLGSWNTETGVFDNDWNDKVEQASFYDDGTHGDNVAGDKIWTVSIPLFPDGGWKTWEWGFNDLKGNWSVIGSNIRFTLFDETPKVTTYVFEKVTGIDNLFTELKVYPNPTGGILTVQGFSIAYVEVFNISGSKVMVNKFTKNSIDVSSLPEGSYFVRLTDAFGKVAISKFHKK